MNLYDTRGPYGTTHTKVTGTENDGSPCGPNLDVKIENDAAWKGRIWVQGLNVGSGIYITPETALILGNRLIAAASFATYMRKNAA